MFEKTKLSNYLSYKHSQTQNDLESSRLQNSFYWPREALDFR